MVLDQCVRVHVISTQRLTKPAKIQFTYSIHRQLAAGRYKSLVCKGIMKISQKNFHMKATVDKENEQGI